MSEYAHAKSAVIVMPNYRLLPEARGADILEDISDFWAWVTGGKLQAFVESREEAKGVVIDLEKIWAHGESAGKCFVLLPSSIFLTYSLNFLTIESTQDANNATGGYLSIQSGLLLPPGTLRIISAAFPMLDWHDTWYTTPHTAPSPTNKPFFNAPLLPRSLLTSHLQSLAPGSTISAADPPERIDLLLSIGQQARWAEFLGTEEKLYPMQEIEKRDEFPPVFIFHGKDDSAVPAVGTERFVDVYKRRFGAEKILCRIEEGDHGFDKPSKLEDEWLVEGLGFVEREWLR